MSSPTRYRGPHEPTDDGRCRHRWANRTTQIVHCQWADGFRAASPSPEPLDAERLARALAQTFGDDEVYTSAQGTMPVRRTAPLIAAEYARLSEDS